MILPSSESSGGTFDADEMDAARSERPADVVRRYLGRLNDGDFEGMMALLGDGRVFHLPDRGIDADRRTAVLLARLGPMAAGLRVSIGQLRVVEPRVRVWVTVQTRVEELLGLPPTKEELLFRVEDGIICEEIHCIERQRASYRRWDRTIATEPFVAWLAEHYPEEVEDLVRASGRLRVHDRSVIAARRRAARQIELLEEFTAKRGAGVSAPEVRS